MDLQQDVAGLLAGLLIALVTTPVGVSGAVFLLPVQLDLLRVPNPQVTPTNLLFNVVAVPGSLVRYRVQGGLAGPLTRTLVLGALPGAVLGAVLRVYVVPGEQAFRLLAAALLLPVGLLVLSGYGRDRAGGSVELRTRHTLLLAFTAGAAGGAYGVGGGSLLAPVLVGLGLPVAAVAPAALTMTFLTSVVGALAYAVIALDANGSIAPDWDLGIACGLGGLVGGYLGARVQPHVPELLLRRLLGGLAVALAVAYVLQTV